MALDWGGMPPNCTFIPPTYGDPKDLKRDAILYKHLFFRASLSEDAENAG